jgi:hypothetical protein
LENNVKLKKAQFLIVLLAETFFEFENDKKESQPITETKRLGASRNERHFSRRIDAGARN